MNKTTAIAAFWSWFADNADLLADHLLQLRADPAQAMAAITAGQTLPINDEMGERLHRLDPRLTFELGLDAPLPGEDAGPDGRMRHLVISADGDRTVFATAWRVVEDAPTVPGWRITALRPRVQDLTRFAIASQHGTIKASTVRYEAKVVPAQPGTVALDLYLPMYPDPAYPLAAEWVGFLLLDAVLGEYDSVVRVTSAVMHPAAGQMPADLPTLPGLPALVDALPAADLR